MDEEYFQLYAIVYHHYLQGTYKTALLISFSNRFTALFQRKL